MRVERILHEQEGADTEDHIGLGAGIRTDQVADDVGAQDLLMNRVGLDVFAVEVSARLGGGIETLEPGQEPLRPGR